MSISYGPMDPMVYDDPKWFKPQTLSLFLMALTSPTRPARCESALTNAWRLHGPRIPQLMSQSVFCRSGHEQNSPRTQRWGKAWWLITTRVVGYGWLWSLIYSFCVCWCFESVCPTLFFPGVLCFFFNIYGCFISDPIFTGGFDRLMVRCTELIVFWEIKMSICRPH